VICRDDDESVGRVRHIQSSRDGQVELERLLKSKFSTSIVMSLVDSTTCKISAFNIVMVDEIN
jgi:hypothetical protein